MRACGVIIWLAVVMTAWPCPAVPTAIAQQNCPAMEKLDQLISDWEAQEVLHPSRLEALKNIADDLRGCAGRQPDRPVSTSSPTASAEVSATFTGRWRTDYGIMQLQQTGDQLEGTYEHNQGRIEGMVADDLFVGTWSEGPTYEEPEDKGDVQFVLAPDGNRFTGKWRNGSKGEWNENWNGHRE